MANIENKIEIQDKNVVREEDVIGLEDQVREQLLEKEAEILTGKMALMRIYPQLDDSSYHGGDRSLGSIDREKFIKACCLKDPPDYAEKKAAETLYMLWINRIVSFHQNGQEEIPIEYKEELKKVKVTHGKDPYWIIRSALQEIQIAARTNLNEKPWNSEEEREATLAELLVKLEGIVVGQLNISNWFGFIF